MHYWQSELNSSEKASNEEIIKKYTDFLGVDTQYLEWLWISIAEHLNMLVINNKLKDTENEDYLGPDDRKFLDKINEELLQLQTNLSEKTEKLNFP